ncbi:MAG: transposase [Clostridiales bacterium]
MYNRKLLSKLSKCAWKVLSNYLKESVSVKDPVEGVVVSIQTFGDFINFNPHIHIVATVGCFDGDGEFVIGNIPNASEVEEVFQIEVLNMLKKEELITDFIIQNMFSWKHSGFNIYCGNVIESENQDGIEKLGRYIIRAPISRERIKYISSNKSHDGIAKVICKSKTTGKAKTFDVLEWCAKVVSHIPNKGEQLVRYYGFYSNKARGQRKKANTDNKIPSLVNTNISKKHFKKNWARLIQKNI